MGSNYIFFYSHTKGNYAEFSQFYQQSFVCEQLPPFHSLKGLFDENYVLGKTFICREQWMMALKALVFDDITRFKLIMKEKVPSKIKAHGRQVQNFDPFIWDLVKYKVVFNGNYLQFTQSTPLLQKLLNTKDKIIVEAAANDKIWGIGFNEKNALNHKDKWGQNLLGEALMEVRLIVAYYGVH